MRCIVSESNRTLQSVLNATNLDKRVKLSVCSGLKAKMSLINETLLVKTFRDEIWAILGVFANIQMPAISVYALYGDVSSSIHLPEFGKLNISSDAPIEWRDFSMTLFAYLAAKRELSYTRKKRLH